MTAAFYLPLAAVTDIAPLPWIRLAPYLGDDLPLLEDNSVLLEEWPSAKVERLSRRNFRLFGSGLASPSCATVAIR